MDDFEENAVIVNALQRVADVVVQKSLAEGFGLTVAEAMWKRRAGRREPHRRHPGPDRARRQRPAARRSASTPSYGSAVLELLDSPERAAAMGEAAHERVRDRFLGTHSLLDYLALFERLLLNTEPKEPA